MKCLLIAEYVYDRKRKTNIGGGSKRVEKIVPKWELLSSHTGRRTFVVNALRLGIPAEVIMRWTGHSSYEAMKPYVKIVDELKKEQMSKFDMI